MNDPDKCPGCGLPEPVQHVMVPDHTTGRSYWLHLCWICMAERDKRIKALAT